MPLLDTLSRSHGVGPACHELDIAPSTYYRHQAQRQLQREGFSVARCTIARLMKAMGLTGVLTISRKSEAAYDRVNFQFVAARPDQLWVADFTSVSTWQGFAYVAFIIDVFAGAIVGCRRRWRLRSYWMRLSRRCWHRSDKGSQYVSLAYTQRLQEAKLLASTGSTGNAMAESINGLYKAEVIHRQRWKNRIMLPSETGLRQPEFPG